MLAFEQSLLLIRGSLTFPTSIPESERRQIAFQSALLVGQKGAITAEKLLTEVKKQTQTYFDRPLDRYVLATSLSVDQISPIPNLKVADAILKFDRKLPKRYVRERSNLIPRLNNLLSLEPPSNYRPVMAYVSARSIHEAKDKALQAIDLVRGIWNWSQNRKVAARMSFSGGHQQVNAITLGPLHTLHKPHGELATTDFWFEPTYRTQNKIFAFGRQAVELTKFYRVVQVGLSRSHYRKDLENAIVKYVAALDMTDLNSAFLRLWSALEYLTDSTGENNIVTAKRTAFIYKDREYVLPVLNHLRTYRNRSIHTSFVTEEIEPYLYLMKSFVERLLDFHLRNNFKFHSVKEAAKFLDMPTDEEALKDRFLMAHRALTFRGHKNSLKAKRT